MCCNCRNEDSVVVNGYRFADKEAGKRAAQLANAKSQLIAFSLSMIFVLMFVGFGSLPFVAFQAKWISSDVVPLFGAGSLCFGLFGGLAFLVGMDSFLQKKWQARKGIPTEVARLIETDKVMREADPNLLAAEDEQLAINEEQTAETLKTIQARRAVIQACLSQCSL